MAKRNGFNPFILLETTSPTPTSDVVIGGGTGQGGLDTPTGPMSYSDWLASDWREDIILNGTIDEYDYAAWWESWEFSQEDWVRLNPSLPWDDYFG